MYDHSQLRRLVVEGKVTEALNYISGLEEKLSAHKDALHIALDWIGRPPGDGYTTAHLEESKARVIREIKS